jgi:hypothetical protein
VPEHVYTRVCLLAEDFRGGPEGLRPHTCDGPKDNSYASVARCVRALLAARKAHYERKSKGPGF